MAINISIDITQNSQNIANNTSNVTVKVTASWTYGSYNKNSKSGWLKIDGTTYDFTSSFNTGQSTSGSQVLFTKTVNVTHAADGKKTLSCSASYTSGVSSGTVTASNSKTLTTIPRASSLTVDDGTLGTELSLTINRAEDTFKHTITYKCGTASGTVGTGLGTSAKWNTSNGNTLNLASQNKTGTTVSVTFTLTTYSGSTAIGTSTKSIAMSIPTTVVPSISAITLSEASSTVPSTYGYVKDYSKLKIVTTAAGVYGSTIKSIAVVYDSVTYSGGTVTTNVLRQTGTRTVSVTVTDSRGRKKTDTRTVNVQAYSKPVINSFTVVRCNADGSLNEQGEYMLVSYNASITALGNKNEKSFTIRYKKSSETNYTSKAISSTAYSVNSTTVIPANSGSSYNVSFDVKDHFATVTKTLILQSAFTILNFKADGTGVGAGKVSEEPNLWDFGFPVRFNKAVNSTHTDMAYRQIHGTSGAHIAFGVGGGGINRGIYDYTQDKWLVKYDGNNTSIADSAHLYTYGKNKLLATPNLYMTADQTVTLSESISAQPHGIVLVFSRFNPETQEVQSHNFNYHFIPKAMIGSLGGGTYGSSFIMATSNFALAASKYLYFTDTTIKGHESNTAVGTAASGIKYNNNTFVLRYVIGV